METSGHWCFRHTTHVYEDTRLWGGNEQTPERTILDRAAIRSGCESCVPSRAPPWLSPGRHAEVLLDEVAGHCQRQQGEEEDGRHVADDAQRRHAQQGGAAEALQRGGDVLVDGVGVGGEPVEDAAEGGGLEQPGWRQVREQFLKWTWVKSENGNFFANIKLHIKW